MCVCVFPPFSPNPISSRHSTNPCYMTIKQVRLTGRKEGSCCDFRTGGLVGVHRTGVQEKERKTSGNRFPMKSNHTHTAQAVACKLFSFSSHRTESGLDKYYIRSNPSEVCASLRVLHLKTNSSQHRNRQTSYFCYS